MIMRNRNMLEMTIYRIHRISITRTVIRWNGAIGTNMYHYYKLTINIPTKCACALCNGVVGPYFILNV